MEIAPQSADFTCPVYKKGILVPKTASKALLSLTSPLKVQTRTIPDGNALLFSHGAWRMRLSACKVRACTCT